MPRLCCRKALNLATDQHVLHEQPAIGGDIVETDRVGETEDGPDPAREIHGAQFRRAFQRLLGCEPNLIPARRPGQIPGVDSGREHGFPPGNVNDVHGVLLHVGPGLEISEPVPLRRKMEAVQNVRALDEHLSDRPLEAKPAANAMDHREVCSTGSPVGLHHVFEELARSAARQRHPGERVL